MFLFHSRSGCLAEYEEIVQASPGASHFVAGRIFVSFKKTQLTPRPNDDNCADRNDSLPGVHLSLRWIFGDASENPGYRTVSFEVPSAE